MLLNYFKIAFRNIWKTKISSSINVVSLSLGIACAILIILFVKDEWTYDKFLSKSDRIYRLWTESERGSGDIVSSPFTPHSMASQMKENYDEIEGYSVINAFNEQVTYNEQGFDETINMASADFFNMFDFEVLQGNVNNALADQNNIIITEEIATKYFGTQNPVGEALNIQVGEEKRDFIVSAVLADLPSNSSIQFSMLVSDENAKYIYPEQMITSWFMISGVNYVMLKEGVNPDELEAKLSTLVDKVLGDRRGDRVYNIHLQPITDIHLNTEISAGFAAVSDPKYTIILVGIALLILTLACINFMILSVGRSMNRAKEIGIRKVVGANRYQLMRQFLSEAILMSVISLIIGIGISYLVLPLFNELSGKRLFMDFDLTNVIAFISLSAIVGLIAGIYPALVISGFQPVKILKGNLKLGSGKEPIKKIMVGAQFVLSIFLVSSTLLMQQQLNHLQNKNLGFDKEQIITVPLNVYDARGVRNGITNGFVKSKQLKNELTNQANIVNVSASSQDFGNGDWMTIGYNDGQDEIHEFKMNVVDHDYVKTMGMNLVQGRDFSKDKPADERRSIIVNEAFVKYFDLDNPVGDRIPNEGFADHEIIGVVQDFNYASLHTAVQPMFLTINGDIGFSGAHNININNSPTPKMMIRLASGNTQEALAMVASTWEKVYPGEPYAYDFINEVLNTQYREEQNLGQIVTSTTTLAVIIACLGLFGLASLTMSARIKEISIRKVLGASIQNIVIVLSRSYLVLIAIALLVSIPFSYYVINDWLNEFEYRIDIGMGAFAFAGAITLIVALITISYQCFKVALTNPAHSLSNE